MQNWCMFGGCGGVVAVLIAPLRGKSMKLRKITILVILLQDTTNLIKDYDTALLITIIIAVILFIDFVFFMYFAIKSMREKIRARREKKRKIRET